MWVRFVYIFTVKNVYLYRKFILNNFFNVCYLFIGIFGLNNKIGRKFKYLLRVFVFCEIRCSKVIFRCRILGSSVICYREDIVYFS